MKAKENIILKQIPTDIKHFKKLLLECQFNCCFKTLKDLDNVSPVIHYTEKYHTIQFFLGNI